MALIQNTLEDGKAEDVSIINLSGKSDMADYMIVASGMSGRHVGSIAEKLIVALKHHAGFSSVRSEGMETCNWVLVDVLDVVVHIFRPEVRKFYNLEKMWAIEIPEDLQKVGELV